MTGGFSRVEFTVPGRAYPQGSKRHVGGGRIIEMAGPPLKQYRSAIGRAAAEHFTSPFDGAVSVGVRFTFQRPKKHHRADGSLREDAPRDCHPAQRGDIDKLTRSVLDGLTSTAFHDDRQVVSLSAFVQWGTDNSTAIWVGRMT